LRLGQNHLARRTSRQGRLVVDGSQDGIHRTVLCVASQEVYVHLVMLGDAGHQAGVLASLNRRKQHVMLRDVRNVLVGHYGYAVLATA
jgi:metallophosphoesterase superfamily enzyme